MKSNLQKLREDIIKEIPEIVVTIPMTGVKAIDCVERPIRLADVLRFLNEISDCYYAVEAGGCFLKFNKIKDVKNTDIYWNLSKNDLNLQSKPTIDFLSRIILKGDEK